MTEVTITRPVLRWLGGKYRLAPWIAGHFPPHEVYVEPFGGAASVMLRKARSYNEIYNDMDGELVNLFAVLRGPRAAELIRAVALTPYAEAEYRAACELHDDPVERARRMIVRSHMAHGTSGARMDRPAGFRVDGPMRSTCVAVEWAKFPAALEAVVERMMGVTITQRPAIDVVRYYDGPDVLLYLDPPYLPATRSAKSKKGEGYHTYAVEMTVEDHEELIDAILASRSSVVLSGYPSDLYDERLQAWSRRTTAARSHMNSPRTEVLWINPAAVDRLEHGPLFVGAGA